MILKVKSFRTPSGKRKQRGRNDMARLIPEAQGGSSKTGASKESNGKN
jgi:hypothetical protein